MTTNLDSFTDILGEVDEICDSQPILLPSSNGSVHVPYLTKIVGVHTKPVRPSKYTGQHGEFRSIEEIDPKYRSVFTYPFFNLVQSRVIDEALYSDKSMVVCAPTGSGKTVIFEMAIVKLLMDLDDINYKDDFKIIYMAPVKALCTERLTEWYPKFTRLGLMCIEVTGDTDVDFSHLKPYRVIITTPEKWDMLTRRWRDHRGLVEVIKLFLIDEVHILNDASRGPVLEAVVSRMRTIESAAQSAHRIEQLKKQYEDVDQPKESSSKEGSGPRIRFVAVSATVSNPDDVAAWLGTKEKPAVFYKFGDECRPVKIKRVVEGYPCSEGTSIFKFDITLNYKLWPIIQKYYDGKPTLIFCNTRKSVGLTADTLSREITINFTPEQKAKLTALASTIKNKKLQALVLSGVGCHHAGLLYEERVNIEQAFRNRDLPILITTTTLAMGVNLPAHLVIVKNTQQYVNGAYQEYSISTVLQMVGRAGRPQFDTEATAVIMTKLCDKPRYQALVGGSEPLQSFLHKRLAENLNSEAALGTVTDVAQCVQWLCSTFLYVRAARDPRRYLALPPAAPTHLISKKIEELCVKAMNGLASAGLITMDEASCIESTVAGRLMSIYYLDLETMKHIMKIDGTESLEKLLWIICESHELADMHLRVDERRSLNALNRNNFTATIRFPMKGKITTRQMKLNCMIQAILGCLPIPDPSLNQEAMKIMRIADRVCKCLVAYVTRPELISTQPQYFSAVLNSLILAKCLVAHLWENSAYVSKQLKGIGPTYSTLLATAGKSNFMLLEESHPRDLERIMNKGAPAGNILRKQISLLPKYQLTMTPIDEKRVSVQLTLLNQAYLAQNMEQLTAGDRHKCYVVVGDSENHLISLTCFMDKDLIGVYDGTITHEIIRKHRFEHKVFVHCISSNIVGIDTQCEYLFKNIEFTPFTRVEESLRYPTEEQTTTKKTAKKQTTVTDTFKQCKRKNSDDITQSKEKKKRDNALLEKIKFLKKSFTMASKEINEDLQKATQVSNNTMNEMIQPEKLTSSSNMNESENLIENNVFRDNNYPIESNTSNYESDYPEMIIEDDDNDCFIVDERIDNILNDIENEIKEKNSDNPIFSTNTSMLESRSLNHDRDQINTEVRSSLLNESTSNKVKNKVHTIVHPYETGIQKNKRKKTRSNYNFIDLLEKNVNLNDDDDEHEAVTKTDTGFSDTIKSEIEKFLQRTKNTISNTYYTNINKLLDNETGTQIIETNRDLDECAAKLKEHETLLINPQLCTNDTEKDEERTEGTAIDMKPLDSNTIHNEQQNCMEVEDLANARKQDLNDFRKNEIAEIGNDQQFKETNVNYHIQRQDYTNRKQNDDTSIFTVDLIINDENRSENHITSQFVNNKDCFNDISTMDVKQMRNEEVNSHSINNTLTSIYQIETKSEFNKPKKEETGNTRELVPFNNKKTEKEKPIDLEEKLLDSSSKGIELLYESMTFKDLNLPGQSQHIINTNSNIIKKINSKREENMYGILDREKNLTPAALPYECKTSRDMLSVTLGKVVSSTCKKTNQRLSVEPLTKMNERNQSAQENTTPTPNFPHFNFNESTMSSLPNKENVCNTMKKCNINTNKKDNYINKYSYTATKIDVCTKNTAEHQLKIIRKVKLDLDVTEIVSLNDKVKVNKNDTEIYKHNKRRKNAESKIHDIVPLPFKNIPSTDMENVNNIEEVATTKDINAEKIINEVNPDVVIAKDTSSTKIMDREKTATITKPETDRFNNNFSDEVGRILQKYSNILRKNKNKFSNNNIETSINRNLNAGTSKSPVKQFKRPYKISDIQNVQVTLPKTLIVEATRSPKPTNNDILTRIRAMEQNEVKCNKGINNIQNFEIPEESHIEENLHDITYSHSPIPEILQLEPSTDFNIDQSMLNPKTLLKCFSTDDADDIIPPPSEFCDGVYSPKFKDDYDFEQLVNPVDYEPQYEPENSFDVTLDVCPEHNGNIFEENSQIKLTPTKEIETWTLSQDEHWEQNNPLHKYNGIKSYTVMRNNSPKDQTVFGSRFNARNAKLDQFKYKHKNKMRL